MKIDVKKQVVDLDGCQIYYPELKKVQWINLHFENIEFHLDFGVGFYTTRPKMDQVFVLIQEGDSKKYLYENENEFEDFLEEMEYEKKQVGPSLALYKYEQASMKNSEKIEEYLIFEAIFWKLKERYGVFPNWGHRWIKENQIHCDKDLEFYHVSNLKTAYHLVESVLSDNVCATEKRLREEQTRKEKAELERRQKEVDAHFEKKYGSISDLKAELVEWVHSNPGIADANQKYNEYEKVKKQMLQDWLTGRTGNEYLDDEEDDWDDLCDCYNDEGEFDGEAVREHDRNVIKRRKKEKEERKLQKSLQEIAKAPYLEFYSNALIGIKLYFHEVYDFYHGIEDERYRLPDDWDVQKALNYLCDAPTYPIARMKFYGAPSTREVDETIAEKRKTALQKYIQSMRMLFAQKGDFRDGEIPEQKKELVDWRDRKEPFQLALKKYFGYKENFEYVERVVSSAKREEIKEAFADYLEFYQNAKVFISDYLNEINRKKDARKEIPQEDLDRALMYFYNTDSPEEAREAVKEKKYRESRQYGEKGEEEVEYALKWLVGDYIKLEKDASGKYGTKAIVLNNKDFVDEPQEFDHIVIGPQGVFNIETKNYTGKIIIDRDGNWIREQSDGRKVGERNPLQQSRRHEAVLRSIVGDDVPIISILAIANPKAIIQGAENSKVKLLKSDVLEEYISNYKGAVSYTKEKIQALADEIEKYRVSK